MYYPFYKSGIRYFFNLQCPNLDKQLTLTLLPDATVFGDIHFYDICKVSGGKVNIAYNNFTNPPFFAVSMETKTMVEILRLPGFSNIAWDWEIIKSFLDHHSLTPTWIYCGQVWGALDKETGTWTGAVGKVRPINCQGKITKNS